MKCTPQKTIASASGRVSEAFASWKESPTKSVLYHFVALVEVAEHHHAIAEGGLGGADPLVQLGGVGLAIGGRELALAGGGRRDHIIHGRAWAVAGRLGVELPGPGGEVVTAGAARLLAGGDELDPGVDGGRGGHGLLLRSGEGVGVSGPRSTGSIALL